MPLSSRSFPATETTQAHHPRPAAFGPAARLGLLAAGTALAGLLLIAANLRPESKGYGTHEQLGLPPCTFMTLFNRPCPSCGMTTSWAEMMHGRPLEAFRTNAGGALLALVALAATPWLLLSALAGRWLGPLPGDRALVMGALAVLAVTLLDWARRLAG